VTAEACEACANDGNVRFAVLKDVPLCQQHYDVVTNMLRPHPSGEFPAPFIPGTFHLIGADS